MYIICAAKTGAAMNGTKKVGGVNPAALAKLHKKGMGPRRPKKKAPGFWGDDKNDKKNGMCGRVKCC